MRRDSIVIGRGGDGSEVDLLVEAAADVSRAHVRIRRDPATGEFYLADLSTYGTAVNGIPAPQGPDREVKLPPCASINMAGVMDLEFAAGGDS